MLAKRPALKVREGTELLERAGFRGPFGDAVAAGDLCAWYPRGGSRAFKKGRSAGPPSGRKGKHPAESVDMPWPLCPLWSIPCPEDQAALAPRVSRIDRWELDTGCPEILDSRSQTVAYQLGQQ